MWHSLSLSYYKSSLNVENSSHGYPWGGSEKILFGLGILQNDSMGCKYVSEVEEKILIGVFACPMMMWKIVLFTFFYLTCTFTCYR